MVSVLLTSVSPVCGIFSMTVSIFSEEIFCMVHIIFFMMYIVFLESQCLFTINDIFQGLVTQGEGRLCAFLKPLPLTLCVAHLAHHYYTFSVWFKTKSFFSTNRYPILDTRISVRSFVCHARTTPLISEMGWTGELQSKTKFLILEN